MFTCAELLITVLLSPDKASLAASKLYVDLSFSNPLSKKPFPTLPVVLEFFGPDKKFKGVAAKNRRQEVQKVTDGLHDVHALPLCSYEQIAWATMGIFHEPMQEEENFDSSQSAEGRRPRAVCVFSNEYPSVPVAELARAVAGLPGPVSLLLQRTKVLELPEQDQKVNEQAFRDLLANVSSLHIRACRNLSGLHEGVANSRSLKVLTLAYCLLEDEVLLQGLVSAICRAGAVEQLMLRACLTSWRPLSHVL